MKFISHRGNTRGINNKKENTIEYINQALEEDFDVEIDVFYYKNEFWFGHDEPINRIKNTKILNSENIWTHAKNIDAAYNLLKFKNANFFWHQEDNITLTSKNFLWTYPNQQLTQKSICVLPEIQKSLSIEMLNKIYGICSDNIDFYRKEIKK